MTQGPCRTIACRRPPIAFARTSLRLLAAPEAWRSAADTRHMKNQFLTEKRGVTSDWYFDQAVALLEFALQHDSATALVYAALEARNALERFVLEMSLLATGGHLS